MNNNVLRLSFDKITVEQAQELAKNFNLEFKNYEFVKDFDTLESAMIFYEESIMDFFEKSYSNDKYFKHIFIGDISKTKRLKEIELLIDLSNENTN